MRARRTSGIGAGPSAGELNEDQNVPTRAFGDGLNSAGWLFVSAGPISSFVRILRQGIDDDGQRESGVPKTRPTGYGTRQANFVSTLLIGFVGGFVAWIATTVVGQPLLGFFQLRSRAAFILERYDGLPWIDNPEAKPPDQEWLEKQREAYDEIGSELVAFADTNSFIARALKYEHLGKYRHYVLNAGDGLRLLGAAFPTAKTSADIRKRVRSDLRLGE